MTMRDLPNEGPMQLLVVEDDARDARLAVEALKESKVKNNLYHVRDGVEAMAFLRGEGGYAGMPLPDLVLLDLNMLKKDG